MKIVTSIKKTILKSEKLRVLVRNLRNLLKHVIFCIRGIGIRTDDKTVIFGAYNGRSYVCSPKAVYEYMIGDKRFKDYSFIWMFDDPCQYEFLKENPNTSLVKSGTSECERLLHRAKYWILNFRALDHWKPRRNQIYVQCWHGTPLKRLGYDITNSDNAMNSISEIREKYRNDAERFNYMISPCDFVTEKFTSAWNLRKFGKEDAVLEVGYPRNDFLTNYSEQDEKRIKEKLNISGRNKKIILYAPTWRDNQHDADKGYVYDNPVDFDYIKEQLNNDYIILFRAHYLVADSFDFNEYEGFIYDVSSYDDINDLYIVADLLITDYSSVFFDYAILGRPMIFYMYDMEEYRDEMRGFYIDIEQLPGTIVKTEQELVVAVNEADSAVNNEMIAVFNNEYNKMNDGHAAQRLVNAVIPM